MAKFQKRAFITGITGQDGSYLAQLLVKKNYKVFGLVRSFKKNSLRNILELYKNKKIILIKGDLGDLKSIEKAIKIANPDEIYNLAAQNDDTKSFEFSEETYKINYQAFGILVNIARELNPKIKIFQAGSAKMFGRAKAPQNENTPFNPVSPYGKAKTKAHNEYVVEYRKKYNLFICTGIFFSHESPRRSEDFIAMIITKSMVKIKLGLSRGFELGNFDIKKDWGYAPEYMEIAWRMLQQKIPEDFVVSTGVPYTTKDFVNETAKSLGMKITWQGKGLKEVAKDKDGNIILRINKKYYNKNSVYYSLGDNTKIQKILNWKIKTNFKKLVKIMVKSCLEKEKNKILK